MFLMVYSIYWWKFMAWFLLLLEILGNMCIAIVCEPGCHVINFQINIILLIKSFLYITEKVNTKNSLSSEQKELLKWNKKHFSSFLKGFQLSKIVSDVIECAFKENWWNKLETPLSKRTFPFSTNPLFLSNFFLTPF